MPEQPVQAQFIPNPMHPGATPVLPVYDAGRPRRGRVLTFVCVVLIGASVTFGYATSREKVYKSSATLRVGAPASASTDRSDAPSSSTSRPAQTLLSRPILSQVLDRLSRRLTVNDLSASDAPDRTAALRNMVTVNEAANARLLELSASGSNKELLPQIVNAWLDVYLEHDEELRSKEDDSTELALASEQAVLERRIDAKRQEVEGFKRSHDIQSMQREDNVVTSRLRGLNVRFSVSRSPTTTTYGSF